MARRHLLPPPDWRNAPWFSTSLHTLPISAYRGPRLLLVGGSTGWGGVNERANSTGVRVPGHSKHSETTRDALLRGQRVLA